LIREDSGNAVLGAYLYQLGLSEDAIVYITRAGPASMQWLSTEEASQHGIDVALLPPPDFVQRSNISPRFDGQQQENLEQRATDFVRALALRWSGLNEEVLRSVDELYADEVRYHGMHFQKISCARCAAFCGALGRAQLHDTSGFNFCYLRLPRW
jgi:hypothetical protein